jgi:hypothetical protein
MWMLFVFWSWPHGQQRHLVVVPHKLWSTSWWCHFVGLRLGFRPTTHSGVGAHGQACLIVTHGTEEHLVT